MSGTWSADPTREHGEVPGRAQLFVALDCERPTERPSSHALRDLDVVAFGRGERRRIARGRISTHLRIELCDRWMSTKHARLVHVAGRWQLEDLGSRNGTRVNGSRIDRAILSDGDVLELGHTFFVYRVVSEEADDQAALHPHLDTVTPELANAFARLSRIAASQLPIVLRGESGTGKELTARAVHDISGRAGPFVAINCAAIPQSLVQSELFGYKKGAFSGAAEDREGLIRSADGGTLFLDEIGDLPPSSQAVLLRVLDDKLVVSLGSTQPLKVDVRVLSATHRDVETMTSSGEFRQDLYARLAGFEFALPPLRRRREDLGLLIAACLAEHASGAPQLSCEAARALFLHDWPLNIRELDKCMASAATLAHGAAIGVEHLPDTVRGEKRGAPPVPSHEAMLESREERDVRLRELLIVALRNHRGNVSAVSRALGRDRKQIHRWIERYGLDVDAYRDG